MTSSDPSALYTPRKKQKAFELENFLKDDFKVKPFIEQFSGFRGTEELEDLTPNASVEQLTELENDLKVCDQDLQSQLTRLLNRDYEKIINLSQNLVGSGGMMKAMDSALESLSKKAVLALRQVARVLQQVTGKLEEKEKLFSYQEMLGNIPGILEEVNSLAAAHLSEDPNPEQGKPSTEAKLSERTKSPSAEILPSGDGATHPTSPVIKKSPTPSPKLAFALERAARSCISIQLRIAPLMSFNIIRDVSLKLERVVEALSKKLFVLFLQGIEIGDLAVCEHSMRAIACLHSEQRVETIVREEIVRIIVASHFSETIFREANPEQLSPALEAFCSEALSKLEPIISLEVPGFYFHFVMNSIWAEVQDVLLGYYNVDPGLFRPSFPEKFHANYSAITGLFTRLQSACPSKQAAQELFYAGVKIRKLWNLGLYFSLQKQRIVTSTEESFKRMLQPSLNSDENSRGFHLRSNLDFWNYLEECWSDRVWLYPISHNLLKLTFQLLRRYEAWVKSTISSCQDTPILVKMLGDVKVILCLIAEALSPRLEELLGESLPSGVKEFLIAILQSLPEELKGRVVLLVSDSCSAALAEVEQVRQNYQLTSKKVAPSVPSGYVTRIFLPLDAANKILQGGPAEISNEVVARVAERYRTRILAMQKSVSRLESSLAALARHQKKMKSANAPAATALTDAGKIKLQLKLDVDSFVKLAADHGVKVEDAPNLGELLKLVEEWGL